jgi:two-component system alkaline phosphatase synthesis response regulator PhoP
LFRVFIIANEVAEISELRSGLTRMGFVCSVANNSLDFSAELLKQACDMLFVHIDGSSASARTESMLEMWEQLRELRIKRPLPTIALISGEGLDCLDSNLEIDDFVVKPWNLAELVARVRRVINQTKNVQSRDIIKCGDLVIDIAKCEVSVGDRLLALTFKEYELLKFLAKKRGRVFTREALLNEVWGYDYYGGDRTVDVHIRRLRSKIEDSSHTFIETVRNIGYRFTNAA